MRCAAARDWRKGREEKSPARPRISHLSPRRSLVGREKRTALQSKLSTNQRGPNVRTHGPYCCLTCNSSPQNPTKAHKTHKARLQNRHRSERAAHRRQYRVFTSSLIPSDEGLTLEMSAKLFFKALSIFTSTFS